MVSGTGMLSSVLDRPESWRVMGIACVMFVIAGAIAYPVL